ncbi:MAG: MBL fold metallo-hydrolase [Chloroflexi bacterium]|nr:MAG: MBL fold metallo-hydrolase [Chloroflexota bacterium]TMD55548.1 MAG: MBL fold metallo-hydrolase [Chloroflexota bacterium]
MRVRRVVADNPSPYTGPGTNTWIVEGDPVAVVIDPGPDDDRHLAAIEERLAGAAVGAILVTHSHPDHLPLAARLGDRHHANVLRYPELGEGDLVQLGKVRLRALHTPGHASDHLCFLQEEDRAVFTGDLVLGKGSTMITYPDGDMAAYLHSLDRLLEVRPSILFPGHWDPVEDPLPKLEEYKRHRLDREEQVLRALAEGPSDSAELTRRVYASEISGEQLLRAAEMTLQAHLRKLVEEGRVRSEGSLYSLP